MTVTDIIEIIDFVWPIAVAVGGLVWGWYQRKYKLPKPVIWAVKALGGAGVSVESIDEVIRTASAMASSTNEERRAWVAEKLQSIASHNGIELTDQTANLIIEWAYGRLKAKTR